MSRLSLGLLLVLAAPVRAEDWPQWLGPDRAGIWRATGLAAKFPKDGPKVLWRVPIGSGYSGPAIVDGKVYVMDRERTKDAGGKPLRPTRKGVLGNERVLCLNAVDGKILWKHEYDCPYTVSYGSGPRCTPLVHKGRVYTLGAMGDLYCLNAETGKPEWSKNLVKEYKVEDMPIWGYAASPMIDGDLLYTLAGGEGSAVVALNKDTGKEEWKALTTDDVGYSPPMIYKAGGKRQLIIWLSDTLNGLDPANGKPYWSIKYPKEKPPSNVTIVTPRLLDDILYISTYYDGGLAVKLDADKPTAKVLWQGTSRNPRKPDGLHILMATPFLRAGHIYGVGGYGELLCLEAATGKEVWSNKEVFGKKGGDCATAFLVPVGDSDRFVIFTDIGDLILADVNAKGYKEIDRGHILDVTADGFAGRKVVWCQPGYANRCVFARNDKEMVCVSLAEK